MTDEEKGHIVRLPTETDWLIQGDAIQESSYDSSASKRKDYWENRMELWLNWWKEKNNWSGGGIPWFWDIAYRELDLGVYMPVEHSKEAIFKYLKSSHPEVRNDEVLSKAAGFIYSLTEPGTQHVTVKEFKSGADYPDKE